MERKRNLDRKYIKIITETQENRKRKKDERQKKAKKKEKKRGSDTPFPRDLPDTLYQVYRKAQSSKPHPTKRHLTIHQRSGRGARTRSASLPSATPGQKCAPQPLQSSGKKKRKTRDVIDRQKLYFINTFRFFQTASYVRIEKRRSHQPRPPSSPPRNAPYNTANSMHLAFSVCVSPDIISSWVSVGLEAVVYSRGRFHSCFSSPLASDPSARNLSNGRFGFASCQGRRFVNVITTRISSFLCV